MLHGYKCLIRIARSSVAYIEVYLDIVKSSQVVRKLNGFST